MQSLEQPIESFFEILQSADFKGGESNFIFTLFPILFFPLHLMNASQVEIQTPVGGTETM